jgi:hypothetical protein
MYTEKAYAIVHQEVLLMLKWQKMLCAEVQLIEKIAHGIMYHKVQLILEAHTMGIFPDKNFT